jgi:UDP-N-acetylglucosamine--N-acetylmuramyl-(pentapeptide) pyrophosphoryl-undecaprenol N-acetylglucosamine transferase
MRIIFAGGGTGGHLFPAIAIAQETLRLKPDAVVSFVGTEKGIEATEVQKHGFPIHFISAVKLERGWSPKKLFENLKLPFRWKACLDECDRLIYQEEPDVVVGTGGFVSAPMVWAAYEWKIPTLIQEQNSMPGIATRILSWRADEVHLSFESSRQFFKRDHVFVSGNPTRCFEKHDQQTARKFFGIDAKRKTLFVFGGSLGARSVNAALAAWLPELLQKFNVIWQTGKLDFTAVESRIGKKENLWVGAFIDRMDMAYAAADLVVCRAGASTLAELAILGMAAVLVPYPFAAGNHQFFNAKTLAENGAAMLIADAEIRSEQSKRKLIETLEDEQKLNAMKTACAKFAKPTAATDIAKRVIALAETHSWDDDENEE